MTDLGQSDISRMTYLVRGIIGNIDPFSVIPLHVSFIQESNSLVVHFAAKEI